MIQNLDREKILEKLKDDEHYYGDFGKQFLSNSDIGALLNNPKDFKADNGENIHLLMGGAFHTMILEPEKFEANYPTVDASSRLTKKYKAAEEENGGMMLLNNDLDLLLGMKKTIEENKLINSLIRDGNVEYEVPAFGEVEGELWKGKADIVHHDEKLIIDLKTTSDITKFHLSARRYNYDSQAYIYKQFFGYDFAFVVIDKKTNMMGYYDCSENFYRNGKEKVQQAVHAYRMFFKGEQEYDWANYLINETL